jgi:hypothetical protein
MCGDAIEENVCIIGFCGVLCWLYKTIAAGVRRQRLSLSIWPK